MKRFLIFTLLFPPLVLFVYGAADPTFGRDLLGVGFLTWMLGWAYLFAVIPAWLTAGVDWALSEKPIYLRLVATMALAAVLAVLIARQLGQRGEVLLFGSMGAIPAAICSLLATFPWKRPAPITRRAENEKQRYFG